MSRSILDDLTSPEVKEFDDSQMGALADAANRLIQKQAEIAAAEERLKQLKAEERNINQGEIPTMMEALGFETLKLTDGRVIGIKDSVQCGIPVAKRPDAHKWMDKHGHGDLIKIAITAKFARGARDSAAEAYDALVDRGVVPTMTESVHSGTLKAWAREELAQGNSLPADLFKIHVVKLTTVK